MHFPKFLNAIDIFLSHSPGSIWRIRWSRLEFLDLFLHPEIPRYVSDQILDHRKSLHRLTVTGLSIGRSLNRVMHINFGIPFTSAEHEPHLPALQFHRQRDRWPASPECD
jgi:hypothetical protein